MTGDFFADGLAEVVPQVPAVGDLDGVRQRAADRFGIGARAVPAHDLHSGMGSQPGLQNIGRAAGQDVDPLAGLGVDQHGGVAVAPAQSEVVHPHHPGHSRLGQGQVQQDAQRGELVIAVHARRLGAAAWTGDRPVRGSRPHLDPPALVRHVLHDQWR